MPFVHLPACRPPSAASARISPRTRRVPQPIISQQGYTMVLEVERMFFFISNFVLKILRLTR